MYTGDQPITQATQDLFNRAPFAKRIADTIARREDPSCLVVGLFGAWGEGKTSVLNLVAENLMTRSHVVVVRFNPWFIQSEAALIPALFQELVEAVGKKLKSRMKKLGSALKGIGTAVSVGPGGAGRALEKLGSMLAQTTIAEQRQRVHDILGDARLRVVVLIDDIDRLAKSELQTVFRTIRLAADFDHLTYVLAFDREVVAAALGEQYGTAPVHGNAFLEKIIQVPLFLPPANSDALLITLYEGAQAALRGAGIDMAQTDWDEFVGQFTSGLRATVRTPRQVKLYENALLFALPILKGEVNVVDQMLIEAVRTFYPELYHVIRQTPRVFLGDRVPFLEEGGRTKRLNEFDQLLATGASRASTRELETLKALILFLFPVAGGRPRQSRQAVKATTNQRISSDWYFDRYFSYALAQSDVSDQEVGHLLAMTSSEENDHLLRDELASLLRRNQGMTITKLNSLVGGMSEAQRVSLALAIASAASGLSDATEEMGSAPPRYLAAWLVGQLLLPLKDEALRNATLDRVVDVPTPLDFAALLFGLLGNPEEQEGPRLEKQQERELLTILGARIAAAAEKEWLFDEREGAGIVRVWRLASPAALEQYLLRNFEADRAKLLRFLWAAAESSTSGERRPEWFNAQSYENVVGLVSEEALAACVTTAAADLVTLDDAQRDRALLQRFLDIRRERMRRPNIDETRGSSGG